MSSVPGAGSVSCRSLLAFLWVPPKQERRQVTFNACPGSSCSSPKGKGPLKLRYLDPVLPFTRIQAAVIEAARNSLLVLFLAQRPRHAAYPLPNVQAEIVTAPVRIKPPKISEKSFPTVGPDCGGRSGCRSIVWGLGSAQRRRGKDLSSRASAAGWMMGLTVRCLSALPVLSAVGGELFGDNGMRPPWLREGTSGFSWSSI